MVKLGEAISSLQCSISMIELELDLTNTYTHSPENTQNILKFFHFLGKLGNCKSLKKLILKLDNNKFCHEPVSVSYTIVS